MNKKVLILGAAGRFGLAATRAFASAGWSVVAQVRAQRPVSGLPMIAGVRWLPCELNDRSALRAAAAGSTVVIHGLNPPYTNGAWAEQAPKLMQLAIDIASALGATVMLPGNVYNFGDQMPSELREDTPQQATHPKGRVRIALEQQLAAATCAGTVRGVVVRAGDFFGSGRGSMFDLAIAKNLHKGKMTFPGHMDVATAWAYLPDLAQTFVRLAERRESLAAFDVFHFCGETLNGKDWADALSEIAVVRGWLRPATTGRSGLTLGHFPWWLLSLAAPLVPMCRSLTDMRYLGQRPHTLDNSKLLALLGSEPHTPFKVAAKAAVDDLFSPGNGKENNADLLPSLKPTRP